MEAKKEMPDKDLISPGHFGCPGCGATLAMKFALKALGENTVVVMPACCWGVIAGPYPQSALKVPLLQTAFASGGAAASGVRAALDMRGDTESTVMLWAGDGGTIDIATDYEEYYDEMIGLLDASPVLNRMDGSPERVQNLGTGMTNFEVKYVNQGREIYRATFLKG